MTRFPRHMATATFVLSSIFALGLSWRELLPVMEKYALIPSLLAASEDHPLEFDCKGPDCVSCLKGIRDTPDGFVFTGGSSFRYAINFEQFSAAIEPTVINCIWNDSRVDAYRSLFNYRHFNQAGQILFHGYNSWAVNSPGTWRGERQATFFVVHYPPDPDRELLERILGPSAFRRYSRVQAAVDLVLLYAHLFLTRTVADAPWQWRFDLRTHSELFKRSDLAFFPLSRAAHQRRRLSLMRRTFSLSAYAQSFMMDAAQLRPPTEISERHEAFLRSVQPTGHIVFFPAPELLEALPDQVKAVSRQSREILLQTLSKHPNVVHIDPDYQACGLTSTDFWFEVQMFFDIPHVNNDAMPKLTKCVTDALVQHNVVRPRPAP